MKRIAFLLASTAPLWTLSAAQAADLPVKAKPVQYVKICTLYGDGYYYIPGSDTCIKFGGYIRAQYGYNAGGGAGGAGIAPGTQLTVTDGLMNRQTAHYSTAHRADLTVDTRTQTQYGTLRTYMDVRFENRIGADFAQATRAFIQWGGFTFGRARSFFDIFTHDQRLSYLKVLTTGDTKDLGINLAAYTVQLAPGVTFSISAEDPARQPVVTGVADGSTNAFAINAGTTLDTHGISHPDIVGNLRIDQPWGYLGVSAAAHANRGLYYGTPNVPTNNYPPDKWGWAAAVGGEANLPWGDTIGANFVYSVGASAYATRSGSWQLYGSSSVGVGWLVDGLFDTSAPHDRTDAGVEHQCRLSAALVAELGHQRVWRLRRRFVQQRGQDHHQPAPAGRSRHHALRGARCRIGLAAGQHYGRQRKQLQPGFQLHAGGLAHAMDPGLRTRYRCRRLLHEAFHGLQRNCG